MNLALKSCLNEGSSKSPASTTIAAFISLLLSLSPVTRRKAILAAGLPLRPWPDWTFTSWILFERFHPLTGIPLSHALLGAMIHLSLGVMFGGWLRSERVHLKLLVT